MRPDLGPLDERQSRTKPALLATIAGKELSLTEFLHSLHMIQIKQLKAKPSSKKG